MRLEVIANINEQRRQAVEQLTNSGEDLLTSIDQETAETLETILTHQQEQEQYLTEMGDGASSSIDQLVSDAQLNLEGRKTEVATHCDEFMLQVEDLGWHSDEMAEARTDFDNALLSITTANLDYVSEIETTLTTHSDTVFTEATSYSDQVIGTLTELRTNYETELSQKGDEVIAEMDKTVGEFNAGLSSITSSIEPELDNKVNEQAENWATQVSDAKTEMAEKSNEGLAEQDSLLSDFSSDVNSQFGKLGKKGEKSFWDSVGDFFSAIGDFVVGVFEGIGMALSELWEGLKMILSSVAFWIVVAIIAVVVVVGVLIALAAGATLAAIGAALLAIGAVILKVVVVIGIVIGVAMAGYYLYLMFTTPGLSARERGQLFGKALFEIGMAALDLGVFAKAKWFAKVGQWTSIANKAGGWVNFLKLFNKVDDVETLVSIINKADNVAEIIPIIDKAQDVGKLVRFLNEAEDMGQILRYLGQAENMNSILSKVDNVGQLIQFMNKVQDAKTLESLLGHVQSGSKLAALLEKVTNGTILERLFKTGKVTNADELLNLLNKVDNPDTLLNLLNSPKIPSAAMLDAILATGKINNADELSAILNHFDSADDLLAFLRQSELDKVDEYARAMENGGDEVSNVRTIENVPIEVRFEHLSPRAQELAQLLKNSEGQTIRVASITPMDLVQLSKWFGREIGVLQAAHIDDLRLVVGTHDGILKGQVNIGEVFVLHTHPTFKSIPEHFELDLINASDRMEGVLDWNNQLTLFNKDGIVNATNPVDGSLKGLSPYHDIPFMNEAGDIVGFQKLKITPDGAGGFDIKAVDELKNVDDGRSITTGGEDDYARAMSGGGDVDGLISGKGATLSDEQVKLLSELKKEINPSFFAVIEQEKFSAALLEKYILAIERAGTDGVAKEALIEYLRLMTEKSSIGYKKLETVLTDLNDFTAKYGDRISGDFAARFYRSLQMNNDPSSAQAEIKLAEDILEGRTALGNDLKVEGLKESTVEGVQTPEYRISGNNVSAIAESKAVDELKDNNLKANVKKAISQIKTKLSPGEFGYIRIDAVTKNPTKIPTVLTKDDMFRYVNGQLLSGEQGPNSAINIIKYVEIQYFDNTNSVQKTLTMEVIDGKLTII